MILSRQDRMEDVDVVDMWWALRNLASSGEIERPMDALTRGSKIEREAMVQ